MAVFLQECRKPQGPAPAVWMGLWGSAEPLWRKGCIRNWKGSFSCWQMTVRSLFPCSTYHIYSQPLSCSATGFSSCASPSRAFFCCWYMPAKLKFLSQIKCISNSLKPRKGPASPHWFADVMSSCSPKPHTCTVTLSGMLPKPLTLHWPQRQVRYVIRKNRHLKSDPAQMTTELAQSRDSSLLSFHCMQVLCF